MGPEGKSLPDAEKGTLPDAEKGTLLEGQKAIGPGLQVDEQAVAKIGDDLKRSGRAM